MARHGLLELRRQSRPWLRYVLVQLLRAQAGWRPPCGRGFLDPELDWHPYLKRTSRDLNKAWRMMRRGKHEAGRFMHDLKRCLLSWVGTPPPPGAPLAMPLLGVRNAVRIRRMG